MFVGVLEFMYLFGLLCCENDCQLSSYDVPLVHLNNKRCFQLLIVRKHNWATRRFLGSVV